VPTVGPEGLLHEAPLLKYTILWGRSQIAVGTRIDGYRFRRKENDRCAPTALALSKSSVVFGKEQAERLSVAVAPQFGGTPAGTVTIKAGTRTVCTVALKSGKGSCVLAAKELKSGTYHLTASYPGRGGFTASASAPRTLKVTG